MGPNNCRFLIHNLNSRPLLRSQPPLRNFITARQQIIFVRTIEVGEIDGRWIRECEIADRIKFGESHHGASGPEEVTLQLTGGRTVVWGAAERPEEKVRLFDALQRTAAGRSAHTVDLSDPEVVTTQ